MAKRQLKTKRQIKKAYRGWRFTSSSTSPRKSSATRKRVHFKETSSSHGGIWRQVSSTRRSH
jgi:hypothetical protein